VIGSLCAALLVVAALLAVPCLVLMTQCLAALGAPKAVSSTGGDPPRVAVLMPAHDEQEIIRDTVTSLRSQIGVRDRLLVIADNCSDDTAGVARDAGAQVYERREADRRGKGFALAFGLEQLATDPPDVVVIVDADCRVAQGGIERLARLAQTQNRPIQADYLLVAPPDSGPKSAVSAFAILVRNRVRARGMAVLGFPVQLTGSGMAFPWQVIRAAAPTGSHVVEDLVMGIDLALKGFGARYTPYVQVTSVLPTSERAATSQRQRWETGQLSTLLRFAPKLMGLGLIRGRLDLIALGLDLCVPPLALLVMLLLALGMVGALLTVFAGEPAVLRAAALDGVLLAVGLVSAWSRFGRATLPLHYVAVIPLYVLWKIPLYLSFLVRGRQKAWVRTERDANHPPLRD
jgi:cellulose synthase/poly-beta-1,6-N-acetylglucosamine synthase-like glycosyltransferase